MRLIYQMFGALLLLIYSNTGMAEHPVVLTSDENSYLDLTSAGASINLFDCQMHVEGRSPNFILVHSQGEEKIPLLAVKSIQDDAFFEVAIHAHFFGLKINRMLFRYYESRSAFTNSIQRFSSFEEKIFPQSDHFLLVEGEISTVGRVLKKHFKAKKVHIFEKTIVLLSRPDMEMVGGYGYESWYGKNNVTQVEYHCVIE